MKKQFVNILSLCIFSSFSHLEAIPYQISVVGTRGIHIDLIQNLVEKELNASSPFVIVEREKTDELISEMGFQQSGATKVNNGVEPGAMLNISHLFSLQTHRVRKDLHLSIQVIEIETGKIAYNYVEKVGYELREIEQNVRRLVKKITARASLLNPVPMKKISGGLFSMGSDSGKENEQPVHAINITDFLIDAYEVENIASVLIGIGGRLGDLMDEAKKAIDPNSHGGTNITAMEKEKIDKAIKEVEANIVNLKLSVGLD